MQSQPRWNATSYMSTRHVAACSSTFRPPPAVLLACFRVASVFLQRFGLFSASFTPRHAATPRFISRLNGSSGVVVYSTVVDIPRHLHNMPSCLIVWLYTDAVAAAAADILLTCLPAAWGVALPQQAAFRMPPPILRLRRTRRFSSPSCYHAYCARAATRGGQP